MKSIFTFRMLLTFMSIYWGLTAQDNFSLGSDYHIVYLDAVTKAKIPANAIKQDFSVDDVKNFLYIWDNTYTDLPTAGMNWNGVTGEFLSLQVNSVGWSGFGFASVGTGKDMSAVDASYTLHLAMKSTGTTTHCIIMEGSNKTAARVAVGSSSFVDGANITPAYTNFTRDGSWHLVEIPMSEFFNKGLQYNSPVLDNVFALLSGGVQGTTIALDAIYIYRKGASAVPSVQGEAFDVFVSDKTISIPNAFTPIELYDLTGYLVRQSSEKILSIEDLYTGIYFVRCNNLTKKILIN